MRRRAPHSLFAGSAGNLIEWYDWYVYAAFSMYADRRGRSASSPLQAFLLVLALLVIVSGYTAVNAIVKAELFPTHVRALGVGLPYAIAVAVFGGTAEYVALWFKSVGNEAGYYWYVTACAAVSLAVYVMVPDTSANSRMTVPEQA